MPSNSQQPQTFRATRAQATSSVQWPRGPHNTCQGLLRDVNGIRKKSSMHSNLRRAVHLPLDARLRGETPVPYGHPEVNGFTWPRLGGATLTGSFRRNLHDWPKFSRRSHTSFRLWAHRQRVGLAHASEAGARVFNIFHFDVATATVLCINSRHACFFHACATPILEDGIAAGPQTTALSAGRCVGH